jgi:hypothetical protein
MLVVQPLDHGEHAIGVVALDPDHREDDEQAAHRAEQPAVLGDAGAGGSPSAAWRDLRSPATAHLPDGPFED